MASRPCACKDCAPHCVFRVGEFRHGTMCKQCKQGRHRAVPK